MTLGQPLLQSWGSGDYTDETKTVGKSPKLQKKWIGPCVVVKKLSDLVYELKPGVRCQQKPVGFFSPPTAAAAATLVRLLQFVLWGRLAGLGLG